MNQLAHLFGRFGSRNVLIAIAVLLFVLNIARAATGFYHTQQDELGVRMLVLQQHQLSVKKLAVLEQRIDALARQKDKVEVYLFQGESVEQATSDMQINLQQQLTSAGLVLETLKPSSVTDKEKSENLGEVIIRVRLNGSLNNFLQFLAGLYQSEKLFYIQSFTLKPDRKSGLTVFLELKGYYRLV